MFSKILQNYNAKNILAEINIYCFSAWSI